MASDPLDDGPGRDNGARFRLRTVVGRLAALLVTVTTVAASFALTKTVAGDHTTREGVLDLRSEHVAALVVQPGEPASETGEATTRIDRAALPGPVVWPRPSLRLGGLDPESVAYSFAIDLIGFEDVISSGFRRVGPDRGEVHVRPTPDGPDTVVELVASDTGWWVSGASSVGVRLDQPRRATVVSNPLRYEGVAQPPGGIVEVRIHVDGSRQPLGSTTIPTGTSEEAVPIEGETGWWQPSSGTATLVVVTRGIDGEVWEAAAFAITVVG